MATKGKVGKEDDVVSYCGSYSGETFSSRRSKAACSLRQHSIDLVAQKLREFPFPDDTKKVITQDPITAIAIAATTTTKGRFNESFHYYRLVVVMLGGLSFGLMILLRLNISVAILNMVNQTALYMHEHPNKTVDDFLAEGYELGGEFEWDNEIQQMIMSWYMIAYTLPQVASTKLGLIVGSRLITPISLSICALATLLTPLAACWGGWQWVIVLRLINGIGASAVLPMMLNIIENWMPYDEITLGLTLSNTLQALIGALSPLVAGHLCSFHWSYAFYVPGVATLLFSALWLVLVADCPDESWLMSEKELNLICGCQHRDHSHDKPHCKSEQEAPVEEKEKQQQEAQTAEVEEKRPTLFDILKVPSFYAYILCVCIHCSAATGFAFVLPTYLRQFLKVDISENGFYCSIIQSGLIVAMIWPHPVLYMLQTKLGLSLTASRRITYAIGCVVVAATWIYVGAFNQYELLLLWIGRCFHGVNEVVVTGSLMGNYASAGVSSLAFSMVNTVGNLSVVFVSTLIGWYLDYTGQSETGWFQILLCLGISQIVMITTFATLIRSEPIEFKKRTIRLDA